MDDEFHDLLNADDTDELIIYIVNKYIAYKPTVSGEVQWSTEREGTPGKLTFTVVKDGVIDFQEGNTVKLFYKKQPVFWGYVFEKNRDKGSTIKVTAYDQLRYLKNKDTFKLENSTVSQFVKMIVEDFGLKCGEIDDTEYVIAQNLMDNKTLFDMIQENLDTTLINTKKLYILYDNFGRINLKNLDNMYTLGLVDESKLENFDYTSSIDGETYNFIKILYTNDTTGEREAYKAKDTENMKNWGMLQYFDTADSPEGLKERAETLLKLYDKKTRKLSLKNVIGDVRVRAGCGLKVKLGLGDISIDNKFVCESVTHTFKEGKHLMDITLWGNDIFG
ncbi:MAG: hydrolase [Candidatus Metalachnospira sp.]|nr:hydrolase [Candidatus Metalachnospira sp.]